MEPDLQRFVEQEKTLGTEPAWFLDSQDQNKLRLSVPLAIDGVIEEGLYLDGHCRADDQDNDVTINMTYKPAQGLSGPLTRLDWNPIHPHGNKGLIGGEWRYKLIQGTHLHPFSENYVKGMKFMFDNNLPIALPCDEPLPNFREMLRYVGDAMKISDIQRIPLPPVTSRLI
jgi:hypothetical protein